MDPHREKFRERHLEKHLKDPERKREESISIAYYISTGRRAITPHESPNSLKPHVLCSCDIDLADLRFLRSYSKYLMTRRRQRRVRKGESAEIRPCELMASWIYGDKFLTGMQFLFGTSSFTAMHDDDLEHSAQQ
jgi:hypothetical protein